MALETGTYTNDLVPANPVASDGLGQADDHLRLIKSALKNTFAGFTSAPLNSSQAQLDAAVASVTGAGYTRIPLGTVALPGLTPIGDTDTGMYSPAANNLAFAVGGVAILGLSSGTINGGANNIQTTGGIAAGAVVNTGAYSGGTGQLVPIGSSLIWHEDALPVEGGYCWANGGTLSRTGNPVLWGRWGTKYGPGDGSTTFNVPNLCEVVPTGQRAMGGASSRALMATGVLGTSVLGSPTATLAATNIPPLTSVQNGIGVNVTSAAATYASGFTTGAALTNNGGAFYGAASLSQLAIGSISSSGSINVSAVSSGTNSTPFAIAQPYVAVNFIIRIG